MGQDLARVLQKLSGTHSFEDEPLDPPGVPSRAVWDVQVYDVIIAHFQPAECGVRLEVTVVPTPTLKVWSRTMGRPTT